MDAYRPGRGELRQFSAQRAARAHARRGGVRRIRALPRCHLHPADVDYSFISYPLSVRLCVASDEERARLLGNTILLAMALALVLVVFMALGTTLLEVDNIVLPACLCYLCWQAQETSRRCLLADFRYRAAVAGDAIALCRTGCAGRAPGLGRCRHAPNRALYDVGDLRHRRHRCMRRSCDLPGRILPKRGYWRVNIFRSASGL